MKSLFHLILFLGYVTSIFFIGDYFLIVVFMINVAFMAKNKIPFIEAFQSLVSILPFVLLTIIWNFIFMNGIQAILIGVRILLVWNITYSYSNTTSVSKIASAMEVALSPLRKLGIRTEGVDLMINIAVSFLPILKNELNQLVLSLRAKGARINIKSMTLVMEQVIMAIFKRTDQIEEALIAKGYQESRNS